MHQAKINLAYDIWSPYVYIDDSTQEATGFGIEFVKLMQASEAAECTKLDITMVQDQWGRMWQDSEGDIKLGDGTNYGLYHGGMTYTHLKGTRPRMGSFTNAITMASSQPAGLLVKLVDGKPAVDPSSDLSGETIVDVSGYAPTTDTLSLVQNHCNDPPTYFAADSVNWIIPEVEGNKAAMEAWKANADSNLMYVYADQAHDCSGAGYTGDCEGWEGFGTEYAYLHMGMAAAQNGTTIAFSKPNSGVNELLNPCIQAVMKTPEYHTICTTPLRPPTQMTTNMAVCFPNEYWTAEERAAAEQGIYAYNHGQRPVPAEYMCADGYCTCAESA